MWAAQFLIADVVCRATFAFCRTLYSIVFSIWVLEFQTGCLSLPNVTVAVCNRIHGLKFGVAGLSCIAGDMSVTVGNFTAWRQDKMALFIYLQIWMSYVDVWRCLLVDSGTYLLTLNPKTAHTHMYTNIYVYVFVGEWRLSLQEHTFFAKPVVCESTGTSIPGQLFSVSWDQPFRSSTSTGAFAPHVVAMWFPFGQRAIALERVTNRG